MQNIALRTYQKNIESWIEENKIEKATFQGYLLLQKFPRNLRTYQILSKGLLQKQDFKTAEKVFDVILQIDPDDFVSHIGKSIISENNAILVEAIDHMKRAFELQPSNEGLQNELKRLLLAQDGVEQNKIQLTRGALIKMYLNGSLYPQAIAESKIGLSETPHRVDYKIALAKSYYESGEYIQAVETCVEIVKELPFCLSANEILDQIITKKHAIQKEAFYHTRLIEIDAYHAFLLPTTQSIFDVPDIAVMVEDESETVEHEYDLGSFIESTWNTRDNEPPLATYESEEVNWDEIINKAVESNVLPNVNENKPKSPSETNFTQTQEEKMTSSRKEIFLNRLRTAKTSESNSSTVPDWFFDENGEITHFENELSSNESENKPDSNTPNVMPIEKFELKSGEDGIFDTDVQPAVNNNSEVEQSKTLWKSDEENINLESTPTLIPKLDDTQPIIVEKETYNDLLQDSSKALEGGNTRFAFDTLQSLISEKKYLPDVVTQLEKALELYPDRCDFRLLLGQAYIALEEKEKALSIFKNTQKFVSL